jgi:putative tricarboxylic transport membrane protein
MFMFMKVVYVSLPLGIEPFAQVSFALMRLMGIK